MREFQSSLRTDAVGRKIDFHARTHSTNDLALQAGRSGGAHGTVFIADAQDAGRGRRGRAWECPSGLGLLFSVLVRPQKVATADLGWLPLLAGLAVSDGVRDACGLSIALKWPNDIVIPNEREPGWMKLGGILCESVLQAAPDANGASGYVVIGIGLNVNQRREDLPRELKAQPTSLQLELTQDQNRAAVLRSILEALERRLLQLMDERRNLGLKRIIESTLEAWWTPQHALTLRTPAGDDNAAAVEGRFSGLDEFGRLKIVEKSGREIVLADAEVLGVR